MKIKLFLKKFLVCLLVVVLLFNFLGAPHAEAAILDRLMENDSLAEGIVGILMAAINVVIVNVARFILMIMGTVATTFGYLDKKGEYTENPDEEIITLGLGDVFFNKVLLTDVNIFNIDLPTDSDASSIVVMRSRIALWYYVMRIIAISVLLGILVYVAIKMAIATLAADKAKYKQMLVDWASSIALVFLLHYLIVVILNLNSAAVRILKPFADDLATGDDMFSSISDLCFSGNFAVELGASIVLVMLVTQTLAFLIFYIKRMLTISFLVIISPLITITYSVDRMGDGKAQALNAWFKEFVFSIIIQPFHCIIYLAFTSVALGILKEAGGGIPALAGAVLAAMCIQFIWNGEKIIKEIFGIKVSQSIGDAVASAAIAGTILNKATSAGSKVATKGVPTALKFGAKHSNVLSQAVKDIGGTNFGQKIGSAVKKMPGYDTLKDKKDSASQSIKNLATKVNNFAPVRHVRNTITGFKKFSETETGQRFKRFTKQNTARAMGVASGIMAMGATYGSSADASLLNAGIAGYAAGKVAYGATNQLLNRKVEHFEDRVSNNQSSMKEITGQEMSASDLGDTADAKLKKGELKDLKEDRKDTKKALKSKLKAQNPTASDNEIDANAESALRKMELGVFDGDLDMQKIADSIGMNKADFQAVVKDYGSNFVYSRVAEDNKEIDELAGESGYHKRALAAMDNMSGERPSIFKYTEEEVENGSKNTADEVFDEHTEIDNEFSSGAIHASENQKEKEYKELISAIQQLMKLLGKTDKADQKIAYQQLLKDGMNDKIPTMRFDSDVAPSFDLKYSHVEKFLKDNSVQRELSTLNSNSPTFEADKERVLHDVIYMGSNGKSIDESRISDEEKERRIKYIESVQKHIVFRKTFETNIVDLGEKQVNP